MSTQGLEVPTNEVILDRFLKESGFSIETLARSITSSYGKGDDSVVRSIICTAYVLGFRDGGTSAFDRAEDIVCNTTGIPK